MGKLRKLLNRTPPVDPGEDVNVAGDSRYTEVRETLSKVLVRQTEFNLYRADAAANSS